MHTCDLTILLLCIYAIEMHKTKQNTRLFIVNIISQKNYKQPTYPATVVWVNKVYLYNGIFYRSEKANYWYMQQHDEFHWLNVEQKKPDTTYVMSTFGVYMKCKTTIEWWKSE